MNKLFQNTFIYTIGNLLPQFVSFALLPLYTKYLTPDEFGITNAMLVLQSLSTVFFTFALDRSIIRLYWDYKEKEKKEFLGSIFISINILSLVFIVIIFLLNNFVNKLFSEIAFYPYFALTILMTYFINYSIIPKNFYRLNNKANKFLMISALEIVLNTALILYFLIAAEEKALGVIKAKFFAALFLLPVYLLITMKNIKLKFNFKILKESMKFSLPMLPSIFSGWILGQADKVFIAGNLSYSDLGIYSLSLRLGSIIGVISGAFTMAYHPIFFKLVNEEPRNEKTLSLLYKYNNSFIIVLLCIGYIIALLSKEFIYLYLNDKYHSAYHYIPPIILAVIIASVSSSILGAFYQQSKKMKQDMIYALIVAGLTIIYYAVFIKRFGLYGALASSILTSLTLFILLYTYARKNCFFIPFKWKQILMIVLYMILSVLVLNYFIDMSLFVGLIIKVLVAIIFVTYLGYINKDFILRVIKRKIA